MENQTRTIEEIRQMTPKELEDYCRFLVFQWGYHSISWRNFPVSFLYKGFDILSDKGIGSFYQYCQHVEIPSEDIERILNKYRGWPTPAMYRQIDKLIAGIGQREPGDDD